MKAPNFNYVKPAFQPHHPFPFVESLYHAAVQLIIALF